MQFADPKNDFAFKKIFGNENHKEILISFLNSILDFKDNQTIVDLTLKNPYQLPDIKELKETILDIKAKNKNNEEFIIEMQKKDLGDFTKRSLYYTSKAYIQQLPKPKQTTDNKKIDFNQLKKVYYIAIVNFTIFDNINYISRHLIINQETTKQDLKDFEFTFIELPKFNKELNEINSIADKWIYFIKNANNLTIMPKEFQKVPFTTAFDIATQITWSQDELEVYDYVMMKEMEEVSALNTAEEKGIRKGKEIGIKEGKELGKKEGLKEGKELGVKEAKIEIAKNLLDVLDSKTISLKTGLSIKEIEKLRKDHSYAIC
jgi:predicted transposase/invertase (TIGR01784 family)